MPAPLIRCNGSSPAVSILLLLIAMAVSSAVNAVEYRAYAPVLNVQPIIETRYEPVSREVCSEPAASVRIFDEPAPTIGKDIRREAQRWQQEIRCRSVTEREAHERVTGYRVTYRYGKETVTTRLSYDPGERMPVHVNLSPLH